MDELEALLDECVRLGASDVHASSDVPVAFRVHGELRRAKPARASGDLLKCVERSLSERQRVTFQVEQAVDFGYTCKQGERFRMNLYRERAGLALAIRRMSNTIPPLERLRLPLQLRELTRLSEGLVLVTGATGSGKSTTLASMIDTINRARACHVLTFEDPVEYVHQNRRAIVHQRELGEDVPTFAHAVRSAMREDPDVMLVGEMRDLETMRASITAAETGHLVLSTLHTGSAVAAIDRIVGSFPAGEQASVRQQLALVLRAVVSQHLLPTVSKRSRVAAVEVLMVTPAVASLIRTNRPAQIRSLMQTGQAQGMQTLEHSLAKLCREGLIDRARASLVAHDPEQLARMLGRDRLFADGGAG